MYRLQNRTGINNQARHHTVSQNTLLTKPHLRGGIAVGGAARPNRGRSFTLRVPF